MKMSQPIHAAMLVASMNSFALDYVARQSVGGTHLNFFILKQLPVPEPGAFFSLCGWHLGISRADWILPRVLELTYTAIDMEGFALDIGYHGQPFQWDDERRFGIRAELDAALFHIYGLDRDDVDYIMETFPIVKRKDITSHGSYRTKEAILCIYDEMAHAIANETTYQTHLDPPPANGWVPPTFPELADGKFAAPVTNRPEVEQVAGVDPGSIGRSERDRALCAMLLSGIQLQGRMSQVIANQLLSHASNPDLVVLDLPMEHKLAAELSVDLVPASVRTSPIAVEEVSNIILHLRNLEAITVGSPPEIKPGPKFSERRSYFGVSIDDWMRLAVQSFNATAPQTEVDASLTQHE